MLLQQYSTISPDGCTIRSSSSKLRTHSPIGPDGLCRYKSDTSASAATANASHGGIHIDTWHERFCHGSNDAIRKLVGHVNGLEISEVDHSNKEAAPPCEGCISGKHHQLPFHPSTTKATRPGERIYCDLCGRIEVKSLGNGLYFAIFTDEFTRLRRVAILSNKTSKTVVKAFKEYMAWFERQSGFKIKALHTDEGSEFEGKMDLLLTEIGIEHETTVGYSSQSNGMAERTNRTLLDMVYPMLFSSGLPLPLWGEAIVTACYVKNRMATQAIPSGKTLYEMFTGRKPNVGHLRAFGSVVYAHIPKKLRKKLQIKSKKGYLVGYESDGEHPMYRVWIPSVNRIILARDVIINERETYPVGDGP